MGVCICGTSTCFTINEKNFFKHSKTLFFCFSVLNEIVFLTFPNNTYLFYTTSQEFFVALRLDSRCRCKMLPYYADRCKLLHICWQMQAFTYMFIVYANRCKFYRYLLDDASVSIYADEQQCLWTRGHTYQDWGKSYECCLLFWNLQYSWWGLVHNQRVLSDPQRTRLYRSRMIWLLTHPSCQ